MTHPRIAEVALLFFSQLGERGIQYAVLRKTERIPDAIGNDIDVLARASEIPLIAQTVHYCAEQLGFRVYFRKDIPGFYPILFQFFEGQLIFLRLDFAHPVRNVERLLRFREQNEKGIYHLPEGIFEKKPIRNVRRFLTFPLRFLIPPGKFIVVIGPDGVGKSTTALYLMQLLEAFHMPVAHLHLGFRPAILPRKQRLLFREKTRNMIEKDQPSAVPGLARFLYHSLDHALGYWFRVRPLLVKGRSVIGERYYYNYLVDPRPKKELGFSLWLPRLFFALCIPKPDALVLLSHDPRVIYERRQEHDIREIGRQLDAYRSEGSRVRRFVEVRTDRPAWDVACEVFDRIFGFSRS